MYLVGWFIVGFALASCAMYLGRQLTGRPPEPLDDAVARSLTADLPPAVPPVADQAGSAEAVRTITSPFASPWWLIALAAVSVVVLSFAAASDRAGFWDCVLWLRSPFLGARFQYLLWGAAVGVFTQIFRLQIADASKQAFDATIGSGEGTAWALQSTLALLIIAAVVFAIKPDLLTYLRSVEYGGFKATFTDHSTTARIADLKYKELLWGFTLEQYSGENFGPSYVSESSDRAKYGDLFFDNHVSKQRRNITNALFGSYVEPIIGSLICLERNHPIKVAAFDPDLIKYGARWVSFLSRLRSEPSNLTFPMVEQFLRGISGYERDATKYVKAIVPDCIVHSVVPDEVTQDTAKIWLNYNDGIAKLTAEGKSGSSFLLLAMIEPYLVAATGDLIVVLNGQKEKAEFLTKMLDGFPDNADMMTPGIVNIFYQTADAQLKSFESWPAEKIAANLDFAIRGADILIDKSSRLVASYNEKVSKEGTSPNASADKDNPTSFFGAMNRNLVILLAEKLALFNQRALSGEALSQEAREEWLRTYSRLIANLRARSNAPIVARQGLPAATLNKQSEELWPSITIEPQYLVDIDIAASISSILLDRDQDDVAGLSCNTALYYLNAAGANVQAYLRADRRPAEEQLMELAKTENTAPFYFNAASAGAKAPAGVDQHHADEQLSELRRKDAEARNTLARTALVELQLKRILSTLHNWAGVPCDWNREPLTEHAS